MERRKAVRFCTCAILLMLGAGAAHADFVEAPAGLEGVGCDTDLAWGDYDNDGDLDIAIVGYSTWLGRYARRIYRNDGGGVFTDIVGPLFDRSAGSTAWGDYDGDGDLDLLLAGDDGYNKVYRNDGSDTFTDIDAGLRDTPTNGCARWGDHDNDGDLDLAFSELVGGSGYCLYRNTGGAFSVDWDSAFYELESSCLAWGDYNNDGDLDIAHCGNQSSGPPAPPVTKYWRNTDGVFTAITTTGLGGAAGTNALACGDYDNDGDLDLVIAGTYTYLEQDQGNSRIFRNDGYGNFTDIHAGLITLQYAAAAWGDYDNDGDLDLALSGSHYEGPGSYSYHTVLYRNDGGDVFTGVDAGFQGVFYSSLAWGDYDNDGDLDLLMCGRYFPGGDQLDVTKLYRNDCPCPPNTPPSAPTGLSTSFQGRKVVFSWNASSDAQTPSSGLSYNMRIGTTSGGNEVFSGMASAAGLRRIPALGNAQMNLSWFLKDVPGGTYYWSVQAIDTAFAGSEWAGEQTLEVEFTFITLPEIKAKPDNADVACEQHVVTAVFGDYFYIEKPNRTCGMMVYSPGHGRAVNDEVLVAGKVKTNANKERYIEASYLSKTDTKTAIKPVAMNNKWLGGGPMGLQEGVDEGYGLNNIGLLIKTWGAFTKTSATTFTITDGSGVSVKCTVPAGVTLDSRWSKVAVTGVSSCEFVGGKVQRVVKVRGQSDIRLADGAMVCGRVVDSLDEISTTVESPHPYPYDYDNTWYIYAPAGTHVMELHFTRITLAQAFDWLYLYDGEWNVTGAWWSGTNLYDIWGGVLGDEARLRLTTDASQAGWGFKVDRYRAHHEEQSVSGVTVTLNPGGKTCVTQPDGSYYFSGLAAGSYTITPPAGNYYPSSQHVGGVSYGDYVTGKDFDRW